MKYKFKRLVVTMKQEYVIQISENGRTNINGWTVERIVDDWFRNNRINNFSSHTIRIRHRLGGADEFIDYEIKDFK